MICPYCGAENPEGTVYCASCGFDMSDNPNQQKPAAQSTQEEQDRAVPKRPVHRKPRRRKTNYRLLLLAALALAGLVIIVSILSSVFDGSRNYHAYKHHIMAEIDNGKVAIIRDNKKAKITELEATTISLHQTSLDGSVTAILTDQGVLAVIQRSKLTVVAENVVRFVLSVDGTGLGYVTKNTAENNYNLKLYNVQTKKTRDITYQASNILFDLAPDGDTLAYYVEKEGQTTYSLFLYNGSKNISIADSVLTLMGLSNDGKCIYAVSKDENGSKVLYSYNQKAERTLIGPCNIRILYMNEDHTQVLYFNSNSEGKFESSISTKAENTHMIMSGSSVASPILPKNCINYTNVSTVTVPVSDLYNKIYSCWDKNGSDIYMIRKNGVDPVKLVGGASYFTLTEKGDYIYYLSDSGLRVLKVSHGQDAAEKSVLLAEDIAEYVVTSDRKLVYYRNSSGLYCVNGKTGNGKKTISTATVADKLHINANDVLFYNIGKDVFASKNGQKGKKVLSDAQSLYSSGNGVVYVFMKDDSIYATSTVRKPRLIWSEK